MTLLTTSQSETFSFSIAPFGVAADRARNYQGIKPQLYIATTQNLPNEPSEEVPLGDVHGRTALIPLVYGPEPVGQSLPQVLLVAKDALFGGYIDQNGEVDEAKFIDQNEEFGYLSVNFKYRKRSPLWVDLAIRRRFWFKICNVGRFAKNPCTMK